LWYLGDGLSFAGEAFFQAGAYSGEYFDPAEGEPRIQLIYREVYGEDARQLDD
jgi:hypothetical protein